MAINRQIIQDQAIDTIRKGIANKNWPTHLPAERLLAEQLGIGRSTLRKVLSRLTEDGTLLPALPNKRREIAPNFIESLQSHHDHHTVNWLAPTPFSEMPQTSLRVITAVKKQLAEQSVLLKILHLPKLCEQAPDKHLAAWVLENPADSWILQSPPLEVRQWFQASSEKAVVAGGITEGETLNAVSIDISLAGAAATRHLLKLGHTQIALIHSGMKKADDTKLADAFSALMAKYHAVIAPVSPDVDAIPTALEKIFSRALTPTAIIVDSPRNAIGVITWLQHHGYSIPQHVSILLLRSQPLMDFCHPSIAHYTFQENLACDALCRWSIDLIKLGSTPSEQIQLASEFVEGDSLCSMME